MNSKLKLIPVIALLCSLVLSAPAASRKQKEAEAKQAAEKKAAEPVKMDAPAKPLFGGPVPDSNPLAAFWNSPEFVKGFMGGYGFNSAIEPQFANTNETAFYRSLAEVIRDTPERAVAMLTTNLTPESSAIMNYTLGTVYFQLGDTTNAVKQFEVALSKFPNFRRAHKNLGLALAKDAKYADAIAPLVRTMELGAVDATTYGLIGFCYLNQEKFVAAEAAYRNAMLMAPQALDWKLGLVKSYVSQNKLNDANALIEEILQEKPDNDAMWKLQAGVFLQMEQPTKAAINYEILRKLGKIDAASLMLLGDIYMSQEQKNLALGPYLEAVEKDPAKAASRGVRAADILVGRGAWAEAQQMIEKVRDVAGTTLEEADQLKLLKLESRLALANNEGAKAAATLEKIVEKNPMDGEALMLLGDYFSREGQREKAEFRYDMASKITGFEADAMVKHAQLLVQLQNYDKAAELLTRAQKIKPRDSIQKYLEQVQRVARAKRG